MAGATYNTEQANYRIAVRDRLRSASTKLLRAFLAMARRLLRPTPGKVDDVDCESIKRILLIRLDAIGDICLSIPAIRCLAMRFPQATLDVMTRPATQAVLEGEPAVHSLLEYRGFRAAVRRIWHKYDLVVSLYTGRFYREAFLVACSGAHYRLGPVSYDRHLFFNLWEDACTPGNDTRHMSRQMLSIADVLAHGQHAPTHSIVLTDKEEERGRYVLAQLGVNLNRLVVGIHYGSSKEYKRIPQCTVATIAQGIVSRCNGLASVVIFSVPGDDEHVSSIGDAAPEIAVIPPLPLRDLILTLNSLDILICANSGPMHIAAALGVPTISNTGPSDPRVWSPLGEGHMIIRKECSGCEAPSKCCRGHRCMCAVTAEDYLAYFDKWLAGRPQQ